MVVRSVTVKYKGRKIKYRWLGNSFLWSSPSWAGGATTTFTTFRSERGKYPDVDVPMYWVKRDLRHRIIRRIEDTLYFNNWFDGAKKVKKKTRARKKRKR